LACAAVVATPSCIDVERPERQHRRYAYGAAIVLLSPGQSIAGHTRDVSRGGLCATLAEPIEVGIDIELDIQLVFDDDRQSEALRVPARIVWCTPIGEDHQVGVQFLPLTGETAEYLTMFLRFLDDGSRVQTTPQAASVDERFG
jgi:hypothetical protein